MEKELTPKQQTSEAIRQAETILIMTGQRPNIDQVAATVALSAILRKFGKKATTIVSDDVPAAAKTLPVNLLEKELTGLRDFILKVDLSHAEVDSLRYTTENGKLNIHVTPHAGSLSEKDVSYDYGDFHFDVVIILGVASYNRVDRVYLQNTEKLQSVPLINIDFHRINEQYGAVNLIEPTAASLAEILMALAESLQPGLIDSDVATTMLTGIMAATDRFTNSYTTAKTMTVAAQMLAMGADQQKIVRTLYKQGEKARQPQKKEPRAEVRTEAPAPIRQSSPPVEITQESQPIAPAQPAYAEPELPAAPVAQAAAVAPDETEPIPTPAAPLPAPEPAPVTPVEPVAVSAPEPVLANDQASEPDVEMPIPEIEPVVAAPEPVAAQEPEPEVQPPTQDPAPAPEPLPEPEDSDRLEELLPPQHIEMEDPEPLINGEDKKKPEAAKPKPNPTNNPIFGQRLDEFEY